MSATMVLRSPNRATEQEAQRRRAKEQEEARERARESLKRAREALKLAREALKLAKEGAKFLDQQVPDWYWRIDLKILFIGNVGLCILGQLYGSYYVGLERLGIDYEQSEYGFDRGCQDCVTYSELTRAFAHEICLRRSYSLN